MSPRRLAVALRRFLVRRPWIYWSVVALAAAGAVTSVLDHADRIDDERRAWGTQRVVWIAAADLAPGDALDVERREVPAAMVPPGALDHHPGALVARQRVGAGEIVHELDVVAPDGPRAMTPHGWLVVPVLESPASGARLGDRVLVVADGLVLADDAVVVGAHADATLVAAPGDRAASIPAAADAGRVTLLLVP